MAYRALVGAPFIRVKGSSSTCMSNTLERPLRRMKMEEEKKKEERNNDV
jgi:hypothetical protein